MPTRIKRFSALLAGIALLVISPSLFAKDEPTATKTVAGVTPEATFEGMKQAASKKDWPGFVSGMTSDTQNMMIGGFTMMAMPGIPGGEKLQGLPELLTKHGAKPLTLNDLIATQGDQKKMMDLMSKAGADVKDKPACIGEVMVVMEKSLGDDNKIGKNFDDIASTTLADVKIDVDTASGTIKSKKADQKDEKITFKKVDGKWYMDVQGMLK